MKKHILTIVLAIFCAVDVFAETKIAVTQHILYMDADQAILDTAVIDSQRVKEQGGKVILRYDFEITDKGFLDEANLYIFLRLPDEYNYFAKKCLRVTALSGAADLRHDVQNAFEGRKYYSEIGESIGRLPEAKYWVLEERSTEKDSKGTKKYKYDYKETCLAIPLKMVNKKGNQAYIEFFIDFNELYDAYNYCLETEMDKEAASWYENLLHEIPIDITFHTKYDSEVSYSIPDDEYIKKYGYAGFFMNIDYYRYWLSDCKASNRSFTIMVN